MAARGPAHAIHFLLNSSVEFFENDSPQVLTLGAEEAVSVGPGGCSAPDGKGAPVRVTMLTNKDNEIRIPQYLE